MKKCILCSEQTTGCVNIYGEKWDFMCQSCKDKEDAKEKIRMDAIAKAMDMFYTKLEGR